MTSINPKPLGIQLFRFLNQRLALKGYMHVQSLIWCICIFVCIFGACGYIYFQECVAVCAFWAGETETCGGNRVVVRGQYDSTLGLFS